MGSYINEIFAKTGMVEKLTMEFEISKMEFITRLKQHIDAPDEVGLFEEFSSSKNDYKGSVNSDSFMLSRRRRFMDFHMGLAKINGSINESTSGVSVNITIGLKPIIPIMLGAFLMLFYVIFIISFLTGRVEDAGFGSLAFVVFHGLIMGGVFYFFFVREVKNGKKSIERDLFFYMNK